METGEFGARLRELRKKAGLSQRELGDKIGVSFTYLSKIESGVMPPPSENIISQLAEVLNANEDELMILAGKIPPDIAQDMVQILKNRDALEYIRADRTKKKIRSANKKEGVSVMKNLVKYKNLSRLAIPIVLVCAMAASLWFASPTPVKALDITITPPSPGTLGSTHTFTVAIDIADAELLPIQSIALYIYKSDARDTYEATANLPLNTTVTPYTAITATGTSGTCGSVSILATATNWDWFSSTGYAFWGTGYSFGADVFGYGYGYTGIASITYAITWTSPPNWTQGNYIIEAKVNAHSDTLTKTFPKTSTQFALYYTPEAEGDDEIVVGAPAPVVVEAGVVDVRNVVTTTGTFTQDVPAISADKKVTVTIEKGTTGKTKEGKRITQISVTPMAAPPAAPPAGATIIGLVYDSNVGDATFDQPVTITFTYDPALIPEGISEEDLVLALWDEDASEWVELPSVVDPETNTISAEVTHMSKYAVIGRAVTPPEEEEVVVPEEEVVVPEEEVVVPEEEEIVPEEEEIVPEEEEVVVPEEEEVPAPVAWWVWLIVGVVVVAVIGVIVWLVIRRRTA